MEAHTNGKELISNIRQLKPGGLFHIRFNGMLGFSFLSLLSDLPSRRHLDTSMRLWS